MITLTGKKISEGIAIGKLAFYKRDIKEIKRIYWNFEIVIENLYFFTVRNLSSSQKLN